MEAPYIKIVRSQVKRHFDPTVVAHDVSHLKRVERHAVKMATEEGADVNIVRAAALLHDYHRYMESATGVHVPTKQAEPLVRQVLAAAGAPMEAVDHICECIEFTERFKCAGDDIEGANPSKEAMVVRDADMLDALGAVGIARAMMYGAKLGEPLTSDEPQGGLFTPGKAKSIIHHFYEKLLQLEAEFMTPAGKAEARVRMQYMRDYLDVLEVELASDKRW